MRYRIDTDSGFFVEAEGPKQAVKEFIRKIREGDLPDCFFVWDGRLYEESGVPEGKEACKVVWRSDLGGDGDGEG